MAFWNSTSGPRGKLIPACPRCDSRTHVYPRKAEADFWCVYCRMPFKEPKEQKIEAIECTKVQMMMQG